MAINIFDNFISNSEQDALQRKLSQPIWRYGWSKNGDFFEKPCLHVFIAGEKRKELKDCQDELKESKQWNIFFNIWQRIKKSNLLDCKLIGVYANGMSHGMETSVHRDNKHNNESKTAVLFAHGYWPQLWGGELVFYDDEKEEIVKAVRPAPKRLVVFDGRIPHGVRMPTAICNQLRISIAFKTHTNKHA